MARSLDRTSAVVSHEGPRASTSASMIERHEAEGTGNVLERIATGIETQNYVLRRLLDVFQDFVKKSGES